MWPWWGSGPAWGIGNVASIGSIRLCPQGVADNESFWEGVLLQDDSLGGGVGGFVSSDARVWA